MERLPAKRHKNFLFLLKYYLFIVNKKLFKLTQCKGFKLLVKGKISVTGNAKKRSYKIYLGQLSFSQKSLKADYQHGLVKTKTGVLGVTFILFF